VDLLAPSAPQALVLLGCRVGGLLLVAPVFASRTVPTMVRMSLLVVLTVLLHPVALGAAGAAAVALTPRAALAETLIGFSIGLGAAVLVGAAEAMGDLLAVQIGLSGAASLDPLTQHSVPVLGQFANLFAITLLLSLDAHLVMLDALVESLRLLPLSSEVDLRAGMAAMVSLGSTLFLLGVRFAAPVIAVVLLANVALAILGRAAPQLNILSVAFPVQIGLGLLAFAATIPLIATFFVGWTTAYDGMLAHVLGALAGEGGR
jgi:flagellar biosynthesis protein FliR